MKPKVRIKGYTEVWKRVFLRDCLEISTEVNCHNVYGKNDVLSVSDDFGVVNQIQHLGRSYAGKSVSGYKILNPGQIVYTKSPLRDKPFGIIKENNYKAGIVSVLYAVYNVKDGIYSKYIQRYFDPKDRINKYLLPLVNKGAKNTMNISDEMALNGEISTPTCIEEQKAICDYFDNIDTLIDKTNARLASLKQMKEASLQAMFPQEGETVPKIRFKGFEGEWKQVRLKDISTKVVEKNKSNSISTTLTNSAEYGIIDQRDFFDHDVSNADNISGYFVVQPLDFVYNPHISTLAPVGPINMNKLGYSGVMSPLYYVFRVVGINKDYLDVFFRTNVWHKFMKDNGNTGARFDRLSINDEVFCEMPIYCPKDENEQQKIASYFTVIDKQIALQNQRLEKLKRIKAACLDNMFV